MHIVAREDLSFPQSLPDFQRIFPDNTACAAYLEKARWSDVSRSTLFDVARSGLFEGLPSSASRAP